ncbi:nucleolar protein 56 [Nematocida sp. AWRm80]|nr:nucleolar protein 56 [Nematocida sp. AWRm80]
MVHILFEHPIGYILMELQKVDLISLKEILKNITNFGDLKKAFNLVGTLIYPDNAEALKQIKASSKGEITSELKEFLEINEVTNLAADKSYNEALKSIGIKPTDEEISMELLRAIRKHADGLFGADFAKVQKAQMGLGHSISRSNVKYDTKREDNSVMQSVALVDEINDDINEYFMKIKEMYSWHFPELATLCKGPEEYLEAVMAIGNRDTVNKEEISKLAKGPEILEVLNMSIGGDLIAEDLESIKDLAEVVMDKLAVRDKATEHLEDRMSTVAPNLSALVGPVVGARLILKAGGLSKLAMCPASTIQVLGAEKALFRALKTKSKTPKYGLIFNSSFINKSAPKMKGRVSRYLSSKCAIASRIDCYSDNVTDKYGQAMKTMVEARAKGASMHQMPTDQVLKKVYKEVSQQLTQ